MLREFRDFITRGNIIDLAVAVILAVAFGAVVSSFTDGVLMAFIAAIFGQPDFSGLTFGVGDGVIAYGGFLTQVVNFLLIGFALFLILKAVNRAAELRRRPGAEPVEDAPAPSDEAVLLTEIRDLLRAQERA